MNSNRILEILREPFREVVEDGEFLGVGRFPGETEETYRTRVAYAMQERLLVADGQEVSARIRERMKQWEAKAQSEFAAVEV